MLLIVEMAQIAVQVNMILYLENSLQLLQPLTLLRPQFNQDSTANNIVKLRRSKKDLILSTQISQRKELNNNSQNKERRSSLQSSTIKLQRTMVKQPLYKFAISAQKLSRKKFILRLLKLFLRKNKNNTKKSSQKNNNS
jgi:predicted RND superfamily exporter protein